MVPTTEPPPACANRADPRKDTNASTAKIKIRYGLIASPLLSPVQYSARPSINHSNHWGLLPVLARRQSITSISLPASISRHARQVLLSMPLLNFDPGFEENLYQQQHRRALSLKLGTGIQRHKRSCVPTAESDFFLRKWGKRLIV